MYWLNFILLFFISGCSHKPEHTNDQNTEFADVIAVEISGDPEDYSFTVTLKSPDTGCDQYANWWEVVSAEGELIHRRILRHSHVDEQPFSRSGGPVTIPEDQVVFVRAHMNNIGYGGQVMKGSASSGFRSTTLEDFHSLAEQEPLPESCAF